MEVEQASLHYFLFYLRGKYWDKRRDQWGVVYFGVKALLDVFTHRILGGEAVGRILKQSATVFCSCMVTHNHFSGKVPYFCYFVEGLDTISSRFQSRKGEMAPAFRGKQPQRTNPQGHGYMDIAPNPPRLLQGLVVNRNAKIR